MSKLASARHAVAMFFYRLEHKLRDFVGLKPRWRWEVCYGCGPFIRCPTCGANCGWEHPDYFAKHGVPCPTCAAVNAAWHKAREDGTAPSTGKFSRESILRARGKRHQELVDMGVQFGTIDDIMSIGRDGTGPLAVDDVVQNEDGSIGPRQPEDKP